MSNTVATCVRCGSDSFRAGEIEPAPEGGFYVVMPCAKCHYPNHIFHDHDPEFAKMLMEFFAAGPPERKT
jgi:predicted nucleic-acid-binding Zn-ribbon protein